MENDKIIIYSFSTKPCLINCYNRNSLQRLITHVWYYALSNIYSKKNGAYTILYTDALGKLFFQDLGYDEIRLLPKDMYDDIHPRFWALAKIKALEDAPLGSIHLDGDAFIKKPELMDAIFNTEYDIMVSHDEGEGSYDKDKFLIEDIKKNHSQLYNTEIRNCCGYNTGILGFKSQELKDTFIKTYYTLAKNWSTKYKKQFDKNNFLTPDLIAEQWSIKFLSANSNKYFVFNDDADKVGFQHVLSNDSRAMYVNKVQELVKYYNSKLYNKLFSYGI